MGEYNIDLQTVTNSVSRVSELPSCFRKESSQSVVNIQSVIQRTSIGSSARHYNLGGTPKDSLIPNLEFGQECTNLNEMR